MGFAILFCVIGNGSVGSRKGTYSLENEASDGPSRRSPSHFAWKARFRSFLGEHAARSIADPTGIDISPSGIWF